MKRKTYRQGVPSPAQRVLLAALNDRPGRTTLRRSEFEGEVACELETRTARPLRSLTVAICLGEGWLELLTQENGVQVYGISSVGREALKALKSRRSLT